VVVVVVVVVVVGTDGPTCTRTHREHVPAGLVRHGVLVANQSLVTLGARAAPRRRHGIIAVARTVFAQRPTGPDAWAWRECTAQNGWLWRMGGVGEGEVEGGGGRRPHGPHIEMNEQMPHTPPRAPQPTPPHVHALLRQLGHQHHQHSRGRSALLRLERRDAAGPARQAGARTWHAGPRHQGPGTCGTRCARRGRAPPWACGRGH
jgi:hypothetical protein